jgi:uncharacterized protein YqjF (DUF2071 family)
MGYRLAGTTITIDFDSIAKAEVPAPDLEQILNQPNGEVYIALLPMTMDGVRQHVLAPVPDRNLFSLVQAILVVEQDAEALWYVLEIDDLMEELIRQL